VRARYLHPIKAKGRHAAPVCLPRRKACILSGRYLRFGTGCAKKSDSAGTAATPFSAIPCTALFDSNDFTEYSFMEELSGACTLAFWVGYVLNAPEGSSF
jgi:hypothetical protein